MFMERDGMENLQLSPVGEVSLSSIIETDQ